MSRKNYKKGFSLVEVLIYVGILGITGTILSGILFNATQIKSRQTVSIEVNNQLNFALQSIQRSVMDSSVIDITNGVSTSTLVLKFKDETQNPTKIYISNGKLYKQVASNEAQPLTGDSVVADAVNFLKISGYSGHDSVQVDLTLSYNTQNPTQTFSRTLSSAIARVSAATFDSNLIPGSDNFYDIGLNSTKWKDMYLSGNLYTTGNVGIGTTGPVIPLDIYGSAPHLGVRDDSSWLRLYTQTTNQPLIYWANGKALRFGTTLTNAGATLSEYMRIDSSGKVGIGTTTPAWNFQVHGYYPRMGVSASSGSSYLRSQAVTGSAGGLELYSGTKSWLVYTQDNAASGGLQFSEDGANTRMTIISGGKVGIGTTTPGEKLEVTDRIKSRTGAYNAGIIMANSAGTNQGGFVLDNSNNPSVYDFVGGAGYMVTFKQGGNVGIGTTMPATKLESLGNVRNSAPSLGYLELSGDLPGYAVNIYPTLKTNYSYLYFSAGGQYSAYMASNGVWTANSDRNKKENFVEVEPQEILAKIDQLPMYQWNFKNEKVSIKHIAPIAQDFYSLFGLNGDNDKMISNIDPSGVALVGVKALSEKVKIQERQIENQQKLIKDLKLEISDLKLKIK